MAQSASHATWRNPPAARYILADASIICLRPIIRRRFAYTEIPASRRSGILIYEHAHCVTDRKIISFLLRTGYYFAWVLFSVWCDGHSFCRRRSSAIFTVLRLNASMLFLPAETSRGCEILTVARISHGSKLRASGCPSSVNLYYKSDRLIYKIGSADILCFSSLSGWCRN